MTHLIHATRLGVTGRLPEPHENFLAAAARLAIDASLDPAFRALALGLPGETDIAREIGADVDPDLILAARSALKIKIAERLAPAFLALQATTEGSGTFSPDAASAGRRALKNVALDYLVASGAPAERARARALCLAADNMTDRLAALTSLVHSGAPEAEGALAHFYTVFRDDPLALDKWFAVQATAPVAAALDRVKALMSDPAFSMANPNRVRALITSFATGNQTQFARPDGAGFAFVADCVLELDPMNPQVAARLLSAFRSWRALEPKRRTLAEKALNRVAAAPGLSRDVADIVGRSLQA